MARQASRSPEGLPLHAMDGVQYNTYIEGLRDEEYPMLKDALYLDHAGTTLPSRKLMDSFHHLMISQLYGNPHSYSKSSLFTAETIETARYRLLDFCRADARHFDIVFTANATASIKIVAEAFRDQHNGFEYLYHGESHTSLVGVREMASSSRCFANDKQVQAWLDQSPKDGDPEMPRSILFAYPAQSNLDGRRLPLRWTDHARQRSAISKQRPIYTLLDAAAYASTAAMDMSDADRAPDFVALSLYKIFGFPDLGALLVRRKSGTVINTRRYFGGGTVELVTLEDDDVSTCPPPSKERKNLQMRKSSSLHEGLEDGTLPYHSISGLNLAIQNHEKLFGGMELVARHTSNLARRLLDNMSNLRHANGSRVVETYRQSESPDVRDWGPVIVFNIRSAAGTCVSLYEFEKLSFARNINVRTGGHCNPGGTAKILGLTSADMRENYKMGHRCGGEADIVNGKPTGTIRVSFGAMSTESDIEKFMSFMGEFFVEKCPPRANTVHQLPPSRGLHVRSLMVYPIKSCAGWAVPPHVRWPVRSEGLAWDREWCVVHVLTGKALSQKRHPRMALIKPTLNMARKVMLVRGTDVSDGSDMFMEIPLDRDAKARAISDQLSTGEVCGTLRELDLHSCPLADDFFTRCLGVPCRLARFPTNDSLLSRRHAKDHLGRGVQGPGVSIALSNESPILTINQASLDRLNEQISRHGGKQASPAVFRANVVLAGLPGPSEVCPSAYSEDAWTGMMVGDTAFDFLGGCRRCQMICIDQVTSERNEEPFSTLARTRRVDGRVVFGVHTSLAVPGKEAFVSVGDKVAIR